MPKFHIITAAVITALAVQNAKTKSKAKKDAELFTLAHEAYEEIQRANMAQIEYLCHLLNENHIGADEFDMIALNYHKL